MQDIIAALTAEHGREAALLWALHRADPGSDDLRERISIHLDGMLIGARRGADALAGLDRPLAGADLFPATWLGLALDQVPPVAGPDDPEGAAAILDARAWMART